MKKKMLLHTTVFFICLYFCVNAFGETVVSENFDDKTYSSPISFYNVAGYDANIVYDASQALAGKGYCLKFDHHDGYLAGLGILSGIPTYIANGMYIRYWVKYSTAYDFPGDRSAFDNLKMFKIWNTEFIYKNTSGGPSALQLYWKRASSGTFTGGTGTGSASLGKTMAKGAWHKIEIFMHVKSSGSSVHVQVDDYNVYQSSNADLSLPASSYSQTNQIISTLASSAGRPAAGRGYWYVDNITIIKGEGDRCNNEPPEPGGTTSFVPNPPTGLAVVD
jgi:hypothetical protein